MSSIKGVLFGLILFFGSFVLLWWNEGRAVKAYQNIHEVRNKTVAISPESLSPEHERQPVHLTAKAETEAMLTDPQFGVSENAIHMRREVEMYQWKENSSTRTRKKLGGGEEKITEYTYEKTWSGSVNRSDSFKEPGPHQNPSTMPYGDWRDSASAVQVGVFSLRQELIQSMNFFEDLTPRNPTLPDGAQLSGNTLYVGESPASPEIGDVRISFSIVPPDTVSVVAAQVGSELTPWTTSNGTPYHRIQRGTHTLEAMMDSAKKEAQMLSWILRGAGWLIMALGISMVLKPLSVFGDVIPFVGSLIGGGIAVVAGLVSAALTLITIAIAWIAVRPLIGAPLLVVAVVLIFLQWKKGRADKALVTPETAA
ncbi:MAG: TMEM43 family protein [Kiritimatiellae bacterium]|nr:TMEM43 family protein [Kiritimatiellia bacterium]